MSVEQIVTGWDLPAIQGVCTTLRQRGYNPYASLVESLIESLRTQTAIAQKLDVLVNSPELNDFAKGVVTEAVHQKLKWGTSHDEGKTAEDWIFLMGHLSGKAAQAKKDGNVDKAKHHCISAAAAMANWHTQILGEDHGMRPGIATPEEEDTHFQETNFPEKSWPVPVVTDDMVRRFLSWPLPKEFHPDGGVRRDDAYLAAFPMHWPTGTNLLHAGQARAMLEHVLSPPAPANADKLIRDTDIQAHTYRSVASGGFVHMPDNGIELHHLPTGIRVRHDAERSLHSNRHHAMLRLREALMLQGWKDASTIIKDASD